MKENINPFVWSDRIDARIISLFSRNISKGIPRDIHNSNTYYSFSYYDIIRVDSVEDKGKSVIKSAYDSAMELKGINSYSRQFMLAFTDIIDDQNQIGYTKEEIDEFWKQGNGKDDVSLLFLTMINLTDYDHLEGIFRKIQKLYPKGKCLVYYTFDHCNMILFCRESTFRNYTDMLFKLNYVDYPLPADTITLYSFSTAEKDYDDKSTFEAYIRIGVKDYAMVEEFHNELNKLGKTVREEWLLGRNDYSFYCPEATVKWLADFREKVIRFSDATEKNDLWYTTYDLTVAIDKTNINFSRQNNEPKKLTGLKDKVSDKFSIFKDLYMRAVNNLNLTPNYVWLRWLYDSSQLAVSLMENYLSESLGTCLIPQFFDLFQYGTRFFEKMCNMKPKDKITQRDQIALIEMSFSKFFANIAILIDSINPTNCQFVQIPSFHLPSFEVQPKIIEFYVAVAYELRDLFQDDDKIMYGLLIAPQFINNLGVASIALQDVLEKDEWLQIVISEPSFYMIQLTMQTLGHEISHFVGQKSRCRDERRKCIIKCAYITLVKNILETACSSMVMEIFRMPEDYKIKEFNCAMDVLTESAERFYNAYEKFYLPSSNDMDSRMIHVKEELYSLAGQIYCNPKLYQKFCDEVFLLLDENETSTKGMSLKDYLRKQHLWLINISHKKDEGREERFINEVLLSDVVKDMFDELMDTMINYYMAGYSDGKLSVTPNDNEGFLKIEKLYNDIQYNFSETFADLQAILVFDMNWEQYCDLIRHDDTKIVADCPLRMLAVTKALIRTEKWSIDSIIDKKFFKSVVKAINLDPVIDSKKLEKLGFNSLLVHYLEEYLVICVDKISEHFNSDPNSQASLSKLREINDKISKDRISILDLQKLIGEFVDDFRKSLIG